MKSFDNFRFIRLYWEIQPADIGFPSGWIRFAKGGEVSAYRGPMHLVLNRRKAGEELDAVILAVNGSTAQVNRPLHSGGDQVARVPGGANTLQHECFLRNLYFLTRAQQFFLAKKVWVNLLLVWLNSLPVRAFVHFQANASDYLTGIVKTLPFPSLTADAKLALERIGHNLALAKWEYDVCYETDPEFRLPTWSSGLSVELDKKQAYSAERNSIVSRLEAEASQIVAVGYGLADLSWTRDLLEEEAEEVTTETGDDIAEELTLRTFARDLVSFNLGTTLGRWDIRLATGEKPAPQMTDPCAPLAVCPPGQLQNEQGLPISKEDADRLKEEGRWNYPIQIPWDGVLVDDPGHPYDLEDCVHRTLQVIWNERWEAIEREAWRSFRCAHLRDYLRKPASFFADHLKHYSKSRRQAPIYEPLSTKSGRYSIWLYYHRLTDQTLHTVLADSWPET